jgi:hypothetical protein
MTEWITHEGEDIANALFELIPRLLGRVRANLPHETDNLASEWHDILALRTTKGQMKLLHILVTHQSCTMQELAEQVTVHR